MHADHRRTAVPVGGFRLTLGTSLNFCDDRHSVAPATTAYARPADGSTAGDWNFGERGRASCGGHQPVVPA